MPVVKLAASNYISAVFTNCGSTVQRQEIVDSNWFAEQTSVKLDGESLEISANTLSSVADSLVFEASIDKKLACHQSVMNMDFWHASNQYISYFHGKVCIALTSRGIRDILHTLSDTFDRISGVFPAGTRLI